VSYGPGNRYILGLYLHDLCSLFIFRYSSNLTVNAPNNSVVVVVIPFRTSCRSNFCLSRGDKLNSKRERTMIREFLGRILYCVKCFSVMCITM